jgi:dUTP pyrophosphatase
MKIKKLNPNAVLPTLGTSGAAAYDMYACIDAPAMIEPGKKAMLSTGLAMQIPTGMVGLIFPRSGLACKRGLRLSNCVAVIDSDYRGCIYISIHNDSDVMQIINPGDRIAQIMFTQYSTDSWEVVDELDETQRGEGGFGSTGTN